MSLEHEATALIYQEHVNRVLAGTEMPSPGEAVVRCQTCQKAFVAQLSRAELAKLRRGRLPRGWKRRGSAYLLNVMHCGARVRLPGPAAMNAARSR